MDSFNPVESPATESPYKQLLRAALLIPVSHYLLGFCLISLVLLYNFLEIHFLQDFFTGFRGQPVTLTFNSSSQLYREVVSKCKVLHERYLSTPWLCSPHLQTVFVHYFGNPPVVNYRRQLFMTSDGGTVALDWVVNAEDKKSAIQGNDSMQHNDRCPIIIIVPGLTSASDSSELTVIDTSRVCYFICSEQEKKVLDDGPYLLWGRTIFYVKHLAFKMAKRGCNVVVSNHRGLGGVSVTSDRFYTAAWTDDVRSVIDHIHCQYPEAPLFAVGTSVGANILVKYLGEDGLNVPVIGAAAICSPWDSLICDRFLRRRFVQRCYNKALTSGLIDYANLHKDVLSRISNWEGVQESRFCRDFDDAATRVLANCETVDKYYRQCSSANYVGRVMVPLLCISALDDPVCTSEAIPWDECRLNKNVILATTQHGGHLPFFEGLTAKSVWWVRAVDEFFTGLKSSPLSHRRKEVQTPVSSANPLETSIDKSPFLDNMKDGNDIAGVGIECHKMGDTIPAEQNVAEEQNGKIDIAEFPERDIGPVERCLNQVSCQNQKSLWLLAYIAIIASWPAVGSSLATISRKMFRDSFI